MKKNIIIGLILIILAVVCAYGSTYIFDAVKGHNGREFITVMFGFFSSFGLVIAGIAKFLNTW